MWVSTFWNQLRKYSRNHKFIVQQMQEDELQRYKKLDGKWKQQS